MNFSVLSPFLEFAVTMAIADYIWNLLTMVLAIFLKNLQHFVDPTMRVHIYWITVCWNKALYVFVTFYYIFET